MDFIQLISMIASIISIPLAIYYAHKTADATSDKARLEIIKTLSYKLSIEHMLSYDDIVSVYKSKLREHKIRNAKFGIEEIIHDLKADIMSNAFIDSQVRSEMLLNLSGLYTSQERVEYIDNVFSRFLYVMAGLLIPVYIVLIIINAVLFLLNLSYFIEVIYYSIYHPNALRGFYDIIREWNDFFYYSKLYISIPCLVAWTILIAANKYFNLKNRRL